MLDIRLRVFLALANLSFLLPGLRQVATPSIRLYRARRAVDEDDEVAVGVTKVGGLPDLPPGTAWPVKLRQGRDYLGVVPTPLSFVGQINFADLTALDEEGALPRDGWLHIFHDAEAFLGADSHEAWRTIHTPASAGVLLRTAPPPDAPRPLQYQQWGLWPDRELALPNMSDEALEDLCGLTFALTDREVEAWRWVWSEVRGLEEPDHPDRMLDMKVASVLGYPDRAHAFQEKCTALWQRLPMRGAPPWSVERPPSNPRDWRMLLRIGALTCWIREQDLVARDFSQVQLLTDANQKSGLIPDQDIGPSSSDLMFGWSDREKAPRFDELDDDDDIIIVRTGDGLGHIHIIWPPPLDADVDLLELDADIDLSAALDACVDQMVEPDWTGRDVRWNGRRLDHKGLAPSNKDARRRKRRSTVAKPLPRRGGGMAPDVR